MPILTNEMFYTAFEPVQKNRFVMYMDGFPTYMIKGVGAIGAEIGKVALNHINLTRYVKGKTKWNNIQFTLHDPIEPSGAQMVMEWVRLHHESVTGRDGYLDFYKKDLVFSVIGPVGSIVREWVIKGAQIETFNMGDYSWDQENAAQEIQLTVQPDYCVLNF